MNRARDIDNLTRLAPVIRRHVVSPGSLVMSFIIATGVWVFNPGGLFDGMALWARALFVYLALVAFLGWSFWGIGPVLLLAYRRGWPLFPTHVIYYLPLAALIAVLLPLLKSDRLSGADVLWNFGVAMALVAISAALGFALYQTFAPTGARLSLRPGQFLWFVQDGCALQERLDPAVRGPVLRMEAANQYVTVFTASGQCLLRLTLKEAEQLITAGQGMRVHRSHWIAFDQMARLTSEQGNPRLECHDRTLIPVSRSHVNEIRDHLPG